SQRKDNPERLRALTRERLAVIRFEEELRRRGIDPNKVIDEVLNYYRNIRKTRGTINKFLNGVNEAILPDVEETIKKILTDIMKNPDERRAVEAAARKLGLTVEEFLAKV
ncbi:MAG: hypothetical protein J7L14_00130, partial [Candidatus Diapherotrites archaeon]|nr:hypothetical protein [Candidatus Diapherotrites archaeon]